MLLYVYDLYISCGDQKEDFFFILRRNNCDWSLGLKDQWKGGLSPELAALQHTATVFKGAGRGSSGFWQLWRGKATCPRPQQRAGGSGGVDAPRHNSAGRSHQHPNGFRAGCLIVSWQAIVFLQFAQDFGAISQFLPHQKFVFLGCTLYKCYRLHLTYRARAACICFESLCDRKESK